MQGVASTADSHGSGCLCWPQLAPVVDGCQCSSVSSAKQEEENIYWISAKEAEMLLNLAATINRPVLWQRLLSPKDLV